MFVVAGMGLTTYVFTSWAPYFALVCVLVSFLMRMISTIVVHYLAVLCGRRSGLELREVIYLGFQGNIKSAIPLALIMKYEHSIDNNEEAITSMILIVVLTVLIYGSFMPLLRHLLIGEEERQHRGEKKMIKHGRSF